MKTKLIAFGIFALSITTKAQVTITYSDVVHIGDTIILAHSGDSTRNPQINVSNQTWDFSNLVEDTNRVWNVVSPSSTPYATTFSNSSLALKNGNAYQFLKADTNALSVNGTVIKTQFTSANVVINFSNPEKLMKFPSSLNGSFSTQGDYTFIIDTTASFPYTLGGFTIQVSIDKIKISGHRKHIVKYDAVGTLITPLDTNNSLRVKDYLIQTDSIYANVTTPAIGYIALPSNTIPGVSNPMIDTTVSYSWYTNNVGYQLLSFDFDSVHNKSSNIKWLKYFTPHPNTSGISEINNSEINIYPNPSNGNINISTINNDLKKIQVYASDGVLVKDIPMIAGKSNYNLNNLVSGIYFVNILNGNNETIKKEKIIIITNK